MSKNNSQSKAPFRGLGVALLLAWAAYRLFFNNNNMTTPNDPSLPRGYRNNNPLNIRISANAWAGKLRPNTDGTFEQFRTMAHGYRAAFVLLRTYIDQYRLTTPRSIIARWAPPAENDTAAYLAAVCSRSGLAADSPLDPYSWEEMSALVHAMAIVENGPAPAPDWQDIRQGWEMS